MQFARALEPALAVKCGGHSPSGKSTCERGMLIDLSLLRGVRVDPRRASRTWPAAACSATSTTRRWRTVSSRPRERFRTRASAGSRSAAASAAWRGASASRSTTCAPSTSSPGNGEILRASAQENPELYWGVRGGGGNFGVVTAFEFDLHPMQRQVIGGIILFPLKQAKSVLSFYSEYEGERARRSVPERRRW